MYHLYKVFKQVIGRWLSFVNSPGLGNELVFPPKVHRVVTLWEYNGLELFLWFYYFFISSVISLHVNFKIYIGAIYRNYATYL